MKSFVTIATFTYPHECTILKHLFEQENLRFYFQNETMIGIVPFYSNALGGIFLKVHPEDAISAEKIIQDFQQGNHPLSIV